MFLFKDILLLVLLCLLVSKHQSISQKLTVHVLYESLCPDSIKFINEQLYPAWNELKPYVNIKFVPFGKSSILQDGQVMCQHGIKECIGNKIQSCTLNALTDETTQVEFVHCFMKNFKNGELGEFGQDCAANVGVNWNYITTCHDSSLGTTLQLQAQELTNQFKPKFVPTILFNGQFNQNAQDASLNDFRNVLCNIIRNIHTDACKITTLQL